MRLSALASHCLFRLLLAAGSVASAQELPSLDVMMGKALFEKTWVSAPASTKASDGLGPFFNARSCNVCHLAGGRGDSAKGLTVVTADPIYGELLQAHAVQGLRAEAQITRSFGSQIILLEDGAEVVLHIPQYQLSDAQYGDLPATLSARIAPALTGLQLLEQVPEHVLAALADPDDSDGDGISGRVSKVLDHTSGELVIGRFGWKADGYSLRMQVAKALRLDMGLSTSLLPSAFGDCTEHQLDCLQMASGNSPASTDPEVSDIMLDLILQYLHSLVPAGQDGAAETPIVQSVADMEMRSARNASLAPGTDGKPTAVHAAATGPGLFASLGCSACHLPALPVANGMIRPFTDLLLHDLGPGLAAQSSESAQAAEWRTAPLWGLAAAQFYLHDGRATTLEEAILWHGGEASSTVAAYSALTDAERRILLSWLHSL